MNESFGRTYPRDTPVVQLNDEHQTVRGTIVDDSVFRVGHKIYHIECQSTHDSNMAVRMIEYDFAIALEQTLAEGAPFEVNLPESCVMYLRSTSSTPDMLEVKVNSPEGDSLIYHARVVKVQSYSTSQMLQKRLLIMLPYFLMRYERVLGQIQGDDVRTAQLIAECSEVRSGLERMAVEDGGTTQLQEMVELILKVSDYLLDSYEDLRRKVDAAMGGEVLELLTDKLAKAEQAEKEARERGLQQGLEQGLEQGRDQGMDRLAAALAEKGVDKDLIASTIEALKSQA